MRALLATTALMLAATPFAAESEARIGAPAPALTLSKSFKGELLTGFKPGKSYVVEFWATWCGPCKVSIPHLTELAKKHKDVTFVGVSVWESGRVVNESDHAKIEAFVKTMGDKMGYNVAADTAAGGMDKGWMDAYGQDGIPAAFIIDQQGRVAYVDHPMSPKFEKALEQVQAGTWDIAKARDEMDVATANRAAAQKSQAAMNEAMKAIAPTVKTKLYEGDFAGAEATVAEAAKANPITTQDGKTVILPASPQVIRVAGADEALYHRYAKYLAKQPGSDPQQLNSIAWNICTSKRLKSPDFAVAAIVATRACELTSYKDAQILDTLGLALFKAGRKEQAVKIQELAVSLADEGSKAELAQRLSEFKKG